MPVLAAEADVALTFAMRHTFKVGRTKVWGRGYTFGSCGNSFCTKEK
jgi:hypothetical protein